MLGSMGSARKMHFVEELKQHYRDLIAGAAEAESGTAAAADSLQREARSREDGKGAAEFGRMARQHRDRRERARREMEALIRFARAGLEDLPRSAKVGLGALVDVSIEDADTGETEERTLFILPVGAGTELLGPGGDGFVSVITPDSPVGRSLMGSVEGDSFEITTRENMREWTVAFVG